MLSGDCNGCVNGKMPSYSATCVECGLSRKNYKPVTNADNINPSFNDEFWNAECGIQRTRRTGGRDMKYAVMTCSGTWITSADTISEACDKFDWKYPGTVIAAMQLEDDGACCPFCGAPMGKESE